MPKTQIPNPKFDPAKRPDPNNPKLIPLVIDKAIHIEQARGEGRYTVTQVRGLYLDVRRMRPGELTPSRIWTLRIMHGYKLNAKGDRKPNIIERSIGKTTVMGLADARKQAILWADELRGGGDVGKRAHKGAVEAQAVVTFRDAAEAVMALRDASWKSDVHRHQWKQTLETYAYPIIGNKPVGDVSLDDVEAILKPLWQTKHATATKLMSRIGMVLDWAIAKKLRTDNPAKGNGPIRFLLPVVAKSDKHHAALPYAATPMLMRRLRALDSISALALEFTILTAVRTSEAIGAKWSEIDLDKALWTIPAERMKAGAAHVVPLSSQVMEILKKMRLLFKPGGWVFPSRFSHLSNMAMLQCLRGLQPGLTVHGFRSTFRDWVADCTDADHAVAEAALAHTVTNAVVASYRRTTFFDKRRALMNEWADYLAGKAA